MIQSSDATQPADTQVNEPVQRPSVIHHGHPDSCNAAGQDPNNDANKNMHRMQYAAFVPQRRLGGTVVLYTSGALSVIRMKSYSPPLVRWTKSPGSVKPRLR